MHGNGSDPGGYGRCPEKEHWAVRHAHGTVYIAEVQATKDIYYQRCSPKADKQRQENQSVRKKARELTNQHTKLEVSGGILGIKTRMM
jgi:SRSO17 transposase